MPSLVGSEMCIRDRLWGYQGATTEAMAGMFVKIGDLWWSLAFIFLSPPNPHQPSIFVDLRNWHCMNTIIHRIILFWPIGKQRQCLHICVSVHIPSSAQSQSEKIQTVQGNAKHALNFGRFYTSKSVTTYSFQCIYIVCISPPHCTCSHHHSHSLHKRWCFVAGPDKVIFQTLW